MNLGLPYQILSMKNLNIVDIRRKVREIRCPESEKLLIRGIWQEDIIIDLIKNGWVDSPLGNLKGSARSYKNLYKESFYNLRTRLSEFGLYLRRFAGPRGGENRAFYVLEVSNVNYPS